MTDDDAVSSTERTPLYRGDGDEVDRGPDLVKIDLLYKAWGLITNVKESNTQAWRTAAAEWLAKWHDVVNH
jgi:hypothetical protein